MERFEYKLENVTADTMAKLNQLGQEGWQVVDIEIIGGLGRPYKYATLMRKVER